MPDENASQGQPSPSKNLGSENPPKQLSSWEKAGILLNGIGTPVTVALIGLLVSSYLNRQQTADTNTRAFAELVSSREQADTNLRKEMFTTLLQSFFKSPPDSMQVDESILKLEILAYNFHESLDLAPMFQEVLRRIDMHTPVGKQQFNRLTKVANEVVIKQVAALKTDVGVTQQATVDFEELRKEPAGIRYIDQTMRLRSSATKDSEVHLDRRFQVEVLSPNFDTKELRVRLIASAPGKTDLGSDPEEVDVVFTLGFFDFPSIDNTRLSNGERCAVVLQSMDEDNAQIILVAFPANRASLKESMYVEDFLKEMLTVGKQR